jgi:hypothetical protein
LADWYKEGTVLQHQAAFMDALRSGRQMRKCIFDTIEQRHAHDFGNSRVGPGLYENLLSAVRESGATEAIKEFENRFFPLLNSDPSRDNADIGSSKEMTNQDRAVADRGRGGWGMILALCVVGFLGALMVGVNALKITAAERPIVKEATRSAPEATEPAPETMTEPAQAVAAETAIPTTKAMEPASEMMTEAVRGISAKQELSREE